MFCKNCGSTVDDAAVVCPHCGTQLRELPSEQKATDDKKNTVAIVGFVLAFLVALAGLICSIIGYRKAVNEGADHKGLALAGIIIAIVNIALGIILQLIVWPQLSEMFNGLLLLA